MQKSLGVSINKQMNYVTSLHAREKLDWVMKDPNVIGITISTIPEDKSNYCVKIIVSKKEIGHRELKIKTIINHVPVIVEYQERLIV